MNKAAYVSTNFYLVGKFVLLAHFVLPTVCLHSRRLMSSLLALWCVACYYDVIY